MCLQSARISPEPHARSLPNFFVHVAYLRGSILIRHDIYDRPHRLSPGRGFLPHGKCIIGQERGCGSAQRGRSMLSTIALFVCLFIFCACLSEDNAQSCGLFFVRFGKYVDYEPENN